MSSHSIRPEAIGTPQELSIPGQAFFAAQLALRHDDRNPHRPEPQPRYDPNRKDKRVPSTPPQPNQPDRGDPMPINPARPARPGRI